MENRARKREKNIQLYQDLDQKSIPVARGRAEIYLCCRQVLSPRPPARPQLSAPPGARDCRRGRAAIPDHPGSPRPDHPARPRARSPRVLPAREDPPELSRLRRLHGDLRSAVSASERADRSGQIRHGQNDQNSRIRPDPAIPGRRSLRPSPPAAPPPPPSPPAPQIAGPAVAGMPAGPSESIGSESLRGRRRRPSG